MVKNEYLGLNIDQVITKLKSEFKDKDIRWSDEFDGTDYIDFILSRKGWYVLCKIEKVYPHKCRFRLIWTGRYTMVKVNKLVEAVCEILFEEFTTNQNVDDTTEL